MFSSSRWMQAAMFSLFPEMSNAEKTVYSGFIQTDWGLNESFLHGHAASYESWTAFDRIDMDSCRGSAGSQCGLSCGVSEHKS